MKVDFSVLFKRNKKRESKTTSIVKQNGDMQFKILSDTVLISESEADHIVKIVCDELKEGMTCQLIAMQIVEKFKEKICTVYLDGGNDGKKWLIKVSNNHLEFID